MSPSQELTRPLIELKPIFSSADWPFDNAVVAIWPDGFQAHLYGMAYMLEDPPMRHHVVEEAVRVREDWFAGKAL